MTSAIAVLLLKASALLGVALLAARLMTRSSASRRHALWSGAFAALMLLPVLALWLPPIEVELPRRAIPAPSTVERALSSASAPATVIASGSIPSRTGLPASGLAGKREWQLPSLRTILLGAWSIGFAIAIVAFAVSMLRVAMLAHRARLVRDAGWWSAAMEIGARLGVATPIRLVTAPGVTTPMASGIVRPTIFLPMDAETWPADRRDVVLAHELAHVASRDPLRHLVGRLALSVYWFHPLAWLAASDATTACEQACDEAVLSLGVRPSSYAQVLLDFADGLPAAPAVALPIVRPRLLEHRLMTILDSSPRPTASRRRLVPIATGAALTLCIAAVRPVEVLPSAPAASTPIASSAAPAPTTTAPAPTTFKTPAKTFAGAAPVASRPAVTPAVDCRADGSNRFNGTMTNTRGGRVERIAQHTFGDLRVCAAADDLDRDEWRPSEWAGRADRLVLETDERTGDLRRMEITRGVTTYSVNGRPAPIDAEVQAWRRSLLAVLDAAWEISELHGRVSSLRGEISSVRGERSSLQGEISSLRGQVSSMQGEISSIRGQESSMRGEISSIRGQMSSLQGQISSERGAISSLQASRSDRYADRDAIDRAIRRHEDEIQRIQGEIARYDVEGRVREVERRIAGFDADARVREVERRIRDFDVEAKVADVERRLRALDVEGQVSQIEGRISSLDAEERSREIERRRDAAVRELRARLRR